MAFLGLLTLLIPLGLGIAALFAAIIAHRGHPSGGTWTLLISTAIYFLSLIGMGVGQYFLISGSIGRSSSSSGSLPDLELYLLILAIAMGLITLSLLAYSIGILLMGLKWGKLSHETAELERLAQKLAMERDPTPTPNPTIS